MASSEPREVVAETMRAGSTTRPTARAVQASSEIIDMIEELMELLEFHGLQRMFYSLDLEKIKFQKMVQYLRQLLKRQKAVVLQHELDMASGEHPVNRPDEKLSTVVLKEEYGGGQEGEHIQNGKQSLEQSRASKEVGSPGKRVIKSF